MRFRKSVKIMKGVRVNFSKSGISTTVGGKGASINFSSRGTFINTGIPGTGLYDRARLGNSGSTRSGSNPEYIKVAVTLGIDDDGNYFIKDENDQLITDEAFLRKIKRTDAYKNKIAELSEKFVAEKNEENQAFINIHKLSPELVYESDVISELEKLSPQIYTKKQFDKKEPNKLSVQRYLEAEAKKRIKSIAFWTLKKRRKEFVDSKLPGFFEKAVRKYNQEKSDFNQKEAEQEIIMNNEYVKECEKEKTEIKSYLAGDQTWVEEKIDTFLQSMTLPVNFSISYEYNSATGGLKVDLDLPEIEDLPTTKATSLASGKAKIKDKTQKELKEEYLKCISGLAFFFASSFFNVSTHISRILISGFTQRVNKNTGKQEDEYVYSIIFNRNEYSKIIASNVDPIAAFESFDHVRNITKAFEISTIIPLVDFGNN